MSIGSQFSILGVMKKVNKKLLEIKKDWLRHILYFGSHLNGIIEFDWIHDSIGKWGIADDTQVIFYFIE